MMAEDGDFLRPIVRTVIEEFLEAEMTEAIGAQKGERVEGRSGYRSGYYPRSLITRVGKLELRVFQDRNGRFSSEIFERYQRSKKALVAALTEMYIQGVSTRKVKAISEELCGHSFSASAIRGFNKKLDEELGRFPRRQLDSESPYLILDARYEKVRENAAASMRCSWASTNWPVADCGRALTEGGSGSKNRPGFGRLLTAVCEGRAGAVLALEASRLAVTTVTGTT